MHSHALPFASNPVELTLKFPVVLALPNPNVHAAMALYAVNVHRAAALPYEASAAKELCCVCMQCRRRLRCPALRRAAALRGAWATGWRCMCTA